METMYCKHWTTKVAKRFLRSSYQQPLGWSLSTVIIVDGNNEQDNNGEAIDSRGDRDRFRADCPNLRPKVEAFIDGTTFPHQWAASGAVNITRIQEYY